MKRLVSAALAVAFLGLAAPTDTSAQVTIGIGAGATIPTGDYGDFANTGYVGSLGLSVPVGPEGLGVGVTGFYGSNNHEAPPSPDGDKTNLLGAAAGLQYAFSTGGSISPYLAGYLGYMQHKYKSDTFPESDASGLIFGGGVGIGFPLGGIGGRVQGTYLIGSGDVDGTDLFAIAAGINIPLGGDM